MKTLLVTGASGFLGSALARHWAGCGHDVHLLLRPTSSRARLGHAIERMTAHEAADPAAAARVLARLQPDAVIHAACAYGRAGETPGQVFDANLMLGMALLQAVLDGERTVSFLNAGSVLAPGLNLYALSKRQFSDWGAQLSARSPQSLRFIDFRLQHMYGPGDDASTFTSHVLRACHANEPALRLTSGEQRRDFIHIDDVVAAYDVVLANATSLPSHEVIDVGSGDAPTIRTFVETVHRLAGSSTRLDFGAIPYRPGEAMLCVADTSRLRALGWHPVHDLISGLQDTLRKEHHP